MDYWEHFVYLLFNVFFSRCRPRYCVARSGRFCTSCSNINALQAWIPVLLVLSRRFARFSVNVFLSVCCATRVSVPLCVVRFLISRLTSPLSCYTENASTQMVP